MNDLSVEKLLPQSETMRLIDRVIKVTDDTALCEMQVRKDNIFFDADINGIYVWIGIELMAQTVAAFAGYRNITDAPKIGLLLSARQFSHTKPVFLLGETLTIQANQVYMEDVVAVFETKIFCDGECVASAKLNAYQPPANK